MPANLPPQYYVAEKRLRAAATPSQKKAILEEMLRIMPKHKGTDHLQADLKSRLAKLRREQAKPSGPTRAPAKVVPKEGAGQVALVGPANSGKSSLVKALTKAQPEVAAYPHTTREPQPGMMDYEDLKFQLLDLPPVSEDYNEPWLWELIKRADLVWLVLSGTGPLSDLELTESVLAQRRIALFPAPGEPPGDPEPGWIHLPALALVSGADLEGTGENIEIMEELIEGRFDLLPVSSPSGQGLEELGRLTFEALGIIRVYTKQPGRPPDLENPFVLNRGGTVGELAARIHQDVAARMKQARVWSKGGNDSRTVNRGHVLADGDTVEITI